MALSLWKLKEEKGSHPSKTAITDIVFAPKVKLQTS